jgi:Methyltransferase TRM13
MAAARALRIEFRQAVGRACKRLLDMGRLVYLRSNGYHSDGLCTYCDLEDSLENGLLLAKRAKK